MCAWVRFARVYMEVGGFYLSKEVTRVFNLSEQTDHSVPNTLIIANCDVVKPHVATENHIPNFNEEASSPFVKKYKTITHPGKVNRIRELRQNKNIIATHTDCPDVLIWDVEDQPNKHAVHVAGESRPDLVLTGHKDNAEFALAMCPSEPFMLSGGKDKLLVLWSIQDHISASGPLLVQSLNLLIIPLSGNAVFLRDMMVLLKTCSFCPSSSQEFLQCR